MVNQEINDIHIVWQNIYFFLIKKLHEKKGHDIYHGIESIDHTATILSKNNGVNKPSNQARAYQIWFNYIARTNQV